MTVNLKYIEAVCNSYNNIDDQRFCFLLHHLGQGINQLNHDINIAFCLILTPTVFKDLILATDLTKVYHHGFDN